MYPEVEGMSEEAELTLDTALVYEPFERQHCELLKLRTILCRSRERSWLISRHNPVKREMYLLGVNVENVLAVQCRRTSCVLGEYDRRKNRKGNV